MLSRSKVDRCVPHTQHVNLRTVSHHQPYTLGPGAHEAGWCQTGASLRYTLKWCRMRYTLNPQPARMIEGNRRLIHVGFYVVDLRMQGVSLERCQKWMFRSPWRGAQHQPHNHSPWRQEQLVDLKISNLPLAHWKNQCLSIYSTNLYEGVKIPDWQINRFARILRAGGRGC